MPQVSTLVSLHDKRYGKVEKQASMLFGELRDCQWGDNAWTINVYQVNEWRANVIGDKLCQIHGACWWSLLVGVSAVGCWVAEDAEVRECECMESCVQTYRLQPLVLPGIVQHRIPSTDTHPTFPGTGQSKKWRKGWVFSFECQNKAVWSFPAIFSVIGSSSRRAELLINKSSCIADQLTVKCFASFVTISQWDDETGSKILLIRVRKVSNSLWDLPEGPQLLNWNLKLTCNNLWPQILSDCSPPGSSIHGMFQTRMLVWVAISSSRGSFPTQGSN